MLRRSLAGLLVGVAAFAQDGRAVPPDGTLVWAKPDHFWFRKAMGSGHVWLTVDAVHGAKEPLFDHQRLAIELGVRGAGDYTPASLPFADPTMEFVVKYDGSNAYIQEGAMAIEFNLGGQFWRCDLQIKWDWNRVPPTDYECLARRPATPGRGGGIAPPAPAVSPDGRWEAFVQDHNLVIRPRGGAGEPRRLSTDGVAGFAYQLGSIQWSRDSRTVSAWRVSDQVWRSASVTGNVKALVVKSEFRLP
jgi:hypothetical protein